MNSFLEKIFRKLDDLNNKYKGEDKIPVYLEEVKNCKEKIDDIKQYKRDYYIRNYDIYKERNRLYRERKKEEKKNININN